MKKTGLKAILFTLICAMIFAGSAFANTAADHVSVAPNGKGDVLIFPVYFTGDGWQTKLVVTNTSMTESVVAKVIIRSKENSQELRDFLIFLSPADVWTGTLYSDGETTRILSTDDSCLVSATTFASAVAPFDTFLENACPGDTNAIGYVTVIQGASFDVVPNRPGVAKTDILAEYNAWAANANQAINVLAGQQEITNSVAGISYALNATTLKNYDYNRANIMNITNETFLGETSNNSYSEVEAALAKDNVVVPYYAQALGSVFAIFTFPTKFASQPTAADNCATRTSWVNRFAGFPSPTYMMTAFDLMENTIVPASQFVSPQPIGSINAFTSEVSFLSVTDLPGSFDEGWLHIDGTNYTTNGLTNGLIPFTYTGIPMIASSMRFNNIGQAGWLYNAYSRGTVDINGAAGVDTVEDRNYQFWSVDGEQ